MTKINKIIMHGFKSFGRRTELLFGDNYNCVLGPNGSGKSNVLDALCFVLGKSSAKSMRSERAANLVYNGGKTKTPAKSGEVSIFFDNSKNIFPLDSEEVKISRIISQKGVSKYKINDEVRTRHQILDLLSHARIDPNGYNIILQGDIVKLVDMSPEEKRKVIEEIAGISIYEERKQKALKELEKVDAQLNEAGIILKERGTYLKELKTDRDKAMKYKELNDRLKRNKATHLHMQLTRKKGYLEDTEKNHEKHKESLERQKSKAAELKKVIEKGDEEMKELTHQITDKGKKDEVALQKEIEQLRVEIGTSKTKIDSSENEITRILQRKEQLQKDVSDVEGRMGDFGKNTAELEKKKENAVKERELIEKKIAGFKQKHKLDAETEQLDKRMEAVDKESEELQTKIGAMREEQQNLLREKDRLEFQVGAIDDQIKKVAELEKEHKSDIAELKKKREQFKVMVTDLNNLLDKSSAFAAEIGRSEEKMQQLRQELAKLEVRSVGIKEQQSGSIAVKRILQNKKQFGEVHGTVAELGNVSSKYTTALTVSAGPRINSIVVQDDKTAADCIKYLKKNKLGTATFLPLNKIKPFPSNPSMKNLVGEKGVHGLAIDLVSFDSKFKDVFSYVFGNTLVVDDIDIARGIGIGNARMATLTGDVAEMSGAMRGGFHQSRGATFKEGDVLDSISKINSEIAQLRKAISALSRQGSQNEEKITHTREKKAAMEGEIIKQERSLHLDSSDLDPKLKEELQERTKSVDEKVRELQDSLGEMNSKLTNLKGERQALRDKVTELRNPRLIAELNAFEEKKSQLGEEIAQADAEMHALKMQLEQIFGRDKDNILNILKGMEKEESRFKDQIKELKEEVKEQESSLKQKESAQSQFYSKFKSLFGERNKLQESINRSDKEVAILEEKSRNEERRINSLSLEIAKVRSEHAALSEEFAPYTGVELFKSKDEADLKREINQFEHMREDMGGVNMRALEIYDTVEKEFNKLHEKKNNLEGEKVHVISMIDEIEGKKGEIFLKTFDSVNEHFQRIFGTLSNKGKAYLDLENPKKPFEGGMTLKVKLTASKFMDIRSLSGGEKTLTALAFIFAVQEYDPASFYVLDEVDAALDKHNSEKLASLISQYAQRAQYIMISHNDAIISTADNLYGVSMDQHGISKVVSLKI